MTSLSVARCLTNEAVARLVDGEADAGELAVIEAHVDRCRDCAGLVASVALARSRAVAVSRQLPGGTASSDAASPAQGLERYEILRKLGEGSMGVVYAARDRLLGRMVALKLLHPSAERRGLKPRLLREATVLAALSHPEIVTVYDFGVEGDQFFLALELVDGGTLRTKLATALPWRDVLALFLRAGAGLAAAHEAGIIHRDFKPDNVLVGVDGRVRVTDFGLARAPGTVGDEPQPIADDGASRPPTSSGTRSGTIVGTPAYMAPEQLHGEEATVASDVFSFCVALYEGLHGYRPFDGETLAELRQSVLEGRVRRAPRGSRVPAPLHRALLEGLRADPGERPASMAALLDALNRAARPRIWRRRAIGLAAAVLGAAVVLGAVRRRAPVAHAGPAVACGALGNEDDVHVDARSSREEVGTAACPFRTITAAIAAHARTIRVGPGTYTAEHGESFPLVLRGVTLVGAGAERTTIEGVGAYDGAASGGVFDRNGELIEAAVVVGDERAPTVLSAVTVRPGTGRRFNYMGIVCDRGATGAPNTTLDGVAVGPDFDVGIVAGTSTRPGPTGCNLRMRSTVVEGTNEGMWALGCGVGEGRVPVAVEIGDGTEAHRNTFREFRASNESRGIGLDVWDCVAAVTVNGNLFESGGTGILMVRHPNELPDRVRIQGNTFRGLARAGIVASRAASIDALEDNVFTGISAPSPDDAPAMGLWIDAHGEPIPPAVRRARRNQFAGNDNGVVVTGPGLKGPALPREILFDFGSEADQGNNEFGCNSRSARHPGYDVLLDVPDATARASLVGNSWDHFPPRPTELTPGAPDGADIVLRGAAALREKWIDPSAHSYGGLCPEGHVLGESPPRR